MTGRDGNPCEHDVEQPTVKRDPHLHTMTIMWPKQRPQQVLIAAEIFEELITQQNDMRAALAYCACPTMGYPGGLTAQNGAETWVSEGNGTDPNIRLALATSIRVARKALHPPLRPGTFASNEPKNHQ